MVTWRRNIRSRVCSPMSSLASDCGAAGLARASLVICRASLNLRPSIGMGDGQFVGGIFGDDLATFVCYHHLLLDTGRRYAVGGRAIGLECKDHSRLDLDRFLEGIEARDDRPFVNAEADPVGEFQAERLHFAAEADFGGL